jgi:hypothetical protein
MKSKMKIQKKMGTIGIAISMISLSTSAALAASPSIQATVSSSTAATQWKVTNLTSTVTPVSGTSANVSISPNLGLTVGMQQALAAQGGESGGGGFYKNSPKELSFAIQVLSTKILGATSSVVSGLYPQWTTQGWTLESFAKVIQQTRFEPATPSNPRPGSDQPLLFNYGVDSGGPYLVALHDFFSSFESVPPYSAVDCLFRKSGDTYNLEVTEYCDDQKSQTLSDIEHRLLHEFSHLLGIGTGSNNDQDSDEFADKIYERLNECYNPHDWVESDLWDKQSADQNVDQLQAKLGKSGTFYVALDKNQKFSIEIDSSAVTYVLKRSGEKTRKGGLIFTESGMMDPHHPDIAFKVVTRPDHTLSAVLRDLTAASNACGDPAYSYDIYFDSYK